MRFLNRALDRFCYKHPNFGIPNLMRFIVFGNVIVFVLFIMNSQIVGLLSFSPALILRGQIWRIITFLFVPNTFSPLWLLISLYFYYFIGNTLEREWGTAKFTIFYFSGTVLTAIFVLIAYLVSGYSYSVYGTYYVNLSMFFAFATLYPNFQVLLFFLIPVKMKWLAYLDAALFLFSILGALLRGNIIAALVPLIAILNYLIYFFDDLSSFLGHTKRYYSRQTLNFKKAAQQKQKQKGYLHKCTVCGRTDTDYPNLEFRYCSRCNGYYCYCMDHINDHVHIQ